MIVDFFMITLYAFYFILFLRTGRAFYVLKKCLLLLLYNFEKYLIIWIVITQVFTTKGVSIDISVGIWRHFF